MIKPSGITGLKILSLMLGFALLNGCDSGAADYPNGKATDGDAFITMSVKLPAAKASAGKITAQSLVDVTRIVITVTDGNGNTNTGEINKSVDTLTLSVKPYTQLTIAGVAYEGGTATYDGSQLISALRPGESFSVNLVLNPIVPPTKPAFVDAGLIDCITAAAAIPANEIIDFSAITNLSCSSRGIKDISGMERLSNLQTLYLSDNNISDITPLQDLMQLTYLDLGSCALSSGGECNGPNSISNLAPLSGLENLIYLNIDENIVSDISMLSGLIKLQTLSASYNRIVNIGKLYTMNSLIDIDLSNNGIEVVALEGLPNLQRLDLLGNKITQFTTLVSLPNLQYLRLSSNYITDFNLYGATDASGDYRNLDTLELSNNNIKNINDLSILTALTKLAMWNNNVEDVDSLKGLSSLRSAYLSGNNIKTGGNYSPGSA